MPDHLHSAPPGPVARGRMPRSRVPALVVLIGLAGGLVTLSIPGPAEWVMRHVQVLGPVWIILACLALWLYGFGESGRALRLATLLAASSLGIGLAFVAGPYLRELSVQPLDLSGPLPDQLLPPAEPDGLAIDLTTTTADDFPQFLGPHRTCGLDQVRLHRDWQSHPPRLMWRQKIGAGWSAFAAVNGFAVTMEQRGPAELITCYEIQTGQLKWAHGIPDRFHRIEIGTGPRATPTIAGGRVFGLGPTGKLRCLEGNTGRLLWQRDLLQEFGIPRSDEDWTVRMGRANSPLVAGDLVIVPAGGPLNGARHSLVAYRAQTGERVWVSGEQHISHSSPQLATLGGIEQVLIVNQDMVSGHELRTGRLLWEADWPGKSNDDANVAQAVAVPPDRVFLSKGYGKGASLLQLVRQPDGTFSAQRVWSRASVLRTHFTNVAIHDGFAYGLSEGILECVEVARGERRWKDGRYPNGQLLRVRDLLLVQNESGAIALVEASPSRANQVLGRFQAIEGRTWNNLCLHGPFLLVRNAEEAACYELAAEP